MTEELKPCPFCGEHGEERDEKGWYACSNNDCPCWHMQAELNDWNTRATLSPAHIEDEREACERWIRQRSGMPALIPMDWDVPFNRYTWAAWSARAALSAPHAAGVLEEWQPMETAPTDGTLLRLLVEFEDHPIEDGAGPFATVGTNYRDNTGEDAWQIVGWCWEQDRFIDGVGTPVGWLPMLAAAPTPSKEHGQ